jgi:putative copper resistance protein D
LLDPLIDARILYFAATLLVAGVVFFLVFVAAPAWRGAEDGEVAVALRARLAWLAWFGLGLALASSAAWLVAAAAGMSGRPLAQVFDDDTLWTVLTQTTFGRAWLIRLAAAGGLAGLFVAFFTSRPRPWISAAVAALAAVLVGALAWAGHGAGGLGTEAIVHPAADVLHLIAAAAWLGALIPLALLFAAVAEDVTEDTTKAAASLPIARTATTRFSSLGIVCVGTLLVSGIVNTWYLAGSINALTHTKYGHLLLLKVALFVAMVAIAAVNRLRLTPKLLGKDAAASRMALWQLRRNAGIEALAGAAVIVIVGVLGTMAPGSHADHHSTSGVIPPDAAFQHIHSEQGMADVTVEPGRVGTARTTIRLWDDDLAPLAAVKVTLGLTAPSPSSQPATRAAAKNSDGAWVVDGVALSEPGNWTVTVDATLKSGRDLKLEAPIVIEAQ